MDLLLEASILLLKLIISEQELLKLSIEELQGSLVLVDDGDVDLIWSGSLLLALVACIGKGVGILQSTLRLRLI